MPHNNVSHDRAQGQLDDLEIPLSIANTTATNLIIYHGRLLSSNVQATCSYGAAFSYSQHWTPDYLSKSAGKSEQGWNDQCK